MQTDPAARRRPAILDRRQRRAEALDATAIAGFETYQRARNLSVATIRNRRSALTSLQAATPVPIVRATTEHLRAHVGRPGLQPGSRRTIRNAFIAFYTYLQHDGIRADNPADGVPPVVVPRGEPRPFSREQIEAMLSSGAYARTRAMILLGYYQGFRVSSIAAVHGRDVDLEAMTIRTVGKGRRDRILPLHPVIADLAQRMPRDSWWFPARRGQTGHITSSGVTDLITRAKIRAGITTAGLTPHSLRHAFGTDLVENGVDIRVVQELMMHESLSTTQVYTRVSARRKREALTALPTMDAPTRSGRTTSEPDEELPIAA